MNTEHIVLGNTILTPDGKAVIMKIDTVDKAVRVKHLEAKTPVTDYRYSDIQPITPNDKP